MSTKYFLCYNNTVGFILPIKDIQLDQEKIRHKSVELLQTVCEREMCD